jgi:hypothetical protein
MKVYNTVNHKSISEWVEFYKSIGLSPIPLQTNSKKSITKNWQTTPIDDQWGQSGYDVNIGIRLGNGIICFDADNQETVDLFESILPKTTAIVYTRTGRHYYYRCSKPDWNQNSYKIKYDSCGGEIRLKDGAYVVTAPSHVTADNYAKDRYLGGYTYQIHPEFSLTDISHNLVQYHIDSLCKIESTKITDKIRIVTTESILDQVAEQGGDTEITVPLIPRDWKKSEILVKKINWLKTAYKGETYVDGKYTYNCRSDVLFSIMSYLIRAGYSRDEASDILLNEGVHMGKRDVEYYMDHAYNSAVSWIANKSNVSFLQNMYDTDFGFKNKSDRVVFKAIISMGLQKLSKTVSVSVSELQRVTGIKHHNTVARSLERLTVCGCIERVGLRGNRYMIGDKNDTSIYTVYRSVKVVTNTLHESLNWEYVLGKKARIVDILDTSQMSMSSQQIIDITGYNKRSAYRYIKELIELGVLLEIKQGKNKYYDLSEGWDTTLYEIVSDHMNKNILSIEERQAKYDIMKREKEEYLRLRNIHGPKKALEIILDRYYGEQNDYWE